MKDSSDSVRDYEEKLNKMLRSQTKSLSNQYHHFLNQEIQVEFDEARTTIRVSIKTKNKLRNLMKPSESFDQLISRILNNYDNCKNELSFLKSQDFKNDIIKISSHEFKRVHDTLTYYPDIKVEYSYNDSKSPIRGEFTYDLEIDHILHKGVPLSEKEGLKLLSIIDKIKSLKELIQTPKKIVEKNKSDLDDKYKSIKTKYLLYFKLLYLIINKNYKKKSKEPNELLLKNFWRDIYYYYDLPECSFEGDVVRKLDKFKSELNQEKMNYERNLLDLK